jgi:hypothetical protein
MVTKLKFPPELAKEIQQRLDQAKELYSRSVSRDGKALCVEGGIGSENYVSPDGDVYVETYDLSTGEPTGIDRSRLVQIAVLVTGSSIIPGLAEMLPKRRPEAPACEKCDGTGWLLRELFSSSPNGQGLICDKCAGLGWIEL